MSNGHDYQRLSKRMHFLAFLTPSVANGILTISCLCPVLRGGERGRKLCVCVRDYQEEGGREGGREGGMA